MYNQFKDKIHRLLAEKIDVGIKLMSEAAQTIQLEKGLSHEEALKVAQPKMKGDHRGFTYDAESGVAKYI